MAARKTDAAKQKSVGKKEKQTGISPSASSSPSIPLLSPQKLAEIEEEIARREDIQRNNALALLAQREYRYYLQFIHRNNTAYVPTKFSMFLADKVQQFVESDTGHALDILIIETPPQHGKSMTITEAFPAWYLGRYPTRRVIEVSYDDGFAEKFGRLNRAKVEEYGELLFNVRLGEKKTTKDFELDNRRGSMLSRGLTAGITGNPADLIIIDDPIKNREEADSPTHREKVWAEWLNSIRSRLSAGGKVIVIMTPWHEDDLAARMLAREKFVQLIRLPIEAEEDDPLGREPGETLCPELGKDRDWLEGFRQTYLDDPISGGARAWTALYMCSPRIEGGNLIQRNWWKWYDPEDLKDGFGSVVLSVDAAFKGGADNDPVCITVWGKRGSYFYLLYLRNKPMTFSETLAEIRTAKGMFPNVGAVLIEAKANGDAIIDQLQYEMFCIPVTPKGGKESRVHAVQPAIEAGHVFLSDQIKGIDEFVEQFSAFPAGKHDDMVDSTTQALAYMLRSSGDYLPASKAEIRELEARNAEARILFDNSAYDPYGMEGW